MSTQIIIGDCRDVLKTLPDASVDSVVTDPPYELGFMGKAWDSSGIAYDETVWRECLRVLKPGGHLLAFGGSRTYHRLACAIEDAGFDVRDQIMWIYSSGFPKSKNLDGDWKGWGTALKPAHEPIVVARKPLIGTVAANVMQHGTGALNIDGCRIGDSGARNNGRRAAGTNGIYGRIGSMQPVDYGIGRWPANVIHDGSEEVLAAFPDAPGQAAAVTGGEPTANGFSGTVKFGGMIGRVASRNPRNDSGSAARFFYCAKASKADREAGCSDLTEKLFGMSSAAAAARGEYYDNGDGGVNRVTERKNHHPTVKPTELMRYLCRLVTPPGGTVLDPFAGSGSTGRAASIEGFDAILIELNAEYAAIAQRRIAGDAPLLQGAAR